MQELKICMADGIETTFNGPKPDKSCMLNQSLFSFLFEECIHKKLLTSTLRLLGPREHPTKKK
jgi:hypothetical protein